jgi:drug/metabolite transporter (DMT)-like permease
MTKIKNVIDKKFVAGVLAVMLAALLWSLDGVFIRPKFYQLPADLVVFLEHGLGFIFLAPFIFLGWSKIKLLRTREWLAIFWICIFGGLIGTIMITQAFFAAMGGQVTFATVVIMQKLQPVFALLLARIILKEKLNKNFYIWAGMAVVAAYFLAFGKSGLNISEIDFFHHAAVYAALAAFAFGSSTVFGKRVVNKLDFSTVTALRFGITALMALLLILITGSIFHFKDLNVFYFKYLFLIVFTSGAFAMYIYYYGLKRIPASVATICELFWPLSAVFLDYVINKNFLNYIQIIASVILLIAFFKIVSGQKEKEFEFTASVIRGSGRGMKMGFPTINLNAINLDLNFGIYLAEAEVDNIKYQGLLHFGNRDTFSEKSSAELYIRVNIPDVHKKEIKVRVIKKIREIVKFKNEEELKLQISADIKELDIAKL